MKYASETIELMAAYPGRWWRMADLVRNAARGRTLSDQERERMRKGLQRVIASLVSAGSVEVAEPSGARGSYACYVWREAPKVGHELLAKWDAKRDNTSGLLRP